MSECKSFTFYDQTVLVHGHVSLNMAYMGIFLSAHVVAHSQHLLFWLVHFKKNEPVKHYVLLTRITIFVIDLSLKCRLN